MKIKKKIRKILKKINKLMKWSRFDKIVNRATKVKAVKNKDAE